MFDEKTVADTIVYYRNMNTDMLLDKFKRLGFRIRTSRDDLGLNQGELAKLSGVSRGYISKLENGEKTNPSIDILKALASALDVPLAYLAGEDFGEGSVQENDAETVDLEIVNLYGVLDRDDQLRLIDYARRLAHDKAPRGRNY